MPSRKAKGNMYGFITYTKNFISGNCPHNCSYCYMKKWGDLGPPRLKEKEFTEDLKSDRYYFIGSGIDMFAENIPAEWIIKILWYLNLYNDNKYLFQSKNPGRFNIFRFAFPKDTILCTTIESNKLYSEHMGETPLPIERATAILFMKKQHNFKTMITIEPIMDFISPAFQRQIKECNPDFVAIGADSGNNGLPEPNKDKITDLICYLKGIKINLKKNLNRLLT